MHQKNTVSLSILLSRCILEVIILVLTPAYAQQSKTTARQRQKIVTNVFAMILCTHWEEGENKQKRVNKGHRGFNLHDHERMV